MNTNRRSLARLTIIVLGTVAAGSATGYAEQQQDNRDATPASQIRAAEKPELRSTAKAEGTHTNPAPGRMVVAGRVLDPIGKPVGGASVLVYARTTALKIDAPADRLYVKEHGHGSTDRSGEFRLDIPRTSSSRNADFGVVALATGFGAGWAELDPDDAQPTANITLRPEHLIQGRVFDLLGRPAANVKLSVTAARRVVPAQPNSRRDGYAGPAFWWDHPDDLPGWPSPAVSDEKGRFTVRGIGKGLRVFLTVIDPRFTNQVLEFDTDVDYTKSPFSVALQPARTITGRVTYADTGKPAPQAYVQISGFDQFYQGLGARPLSTITDADGRFHTNPGPGSEGFIYAFTPGGQPYLMIGREIEWPKGAVEYSADLALPRGKVVRGKVTEHGSGRPVQNARVTFFYGRSADDSLPGRQSAPTLTAGDGTFTLIAPPRRGYLIVRAADDNFTFQALDRSLLLFGQPGGQRAYAHAFLPLEVKPNDASQEGQTQNLVVYPSAPVKGRVADSNGQSISEVWVFSRVCLDPRMPMAFRTWMPAEHPLTRDGRFELHGLDSETEVPVCFLEPKRRLGATVLYSGKHAEQEMVVKLEPCGAAVARLVGPDGKPLGNYRPRYLIALVVTPGASVGIRAPNANTTLADQAALNLVDPINYAKDLASDPQGKIEFPALIPGATYRLVDPTPGRTAKGPQLRKEFTVKPGENRDLGDILIEKPMP